MELHFAVFIRPVLEPVTGDLAGAFRHGDLPSPGDVRGHKVLGSGVQGLADAGIEAGNNILVRQAAKPDFLIICFALADGVCTAGLHQTADGDEICVVGHLDPVLDRNMPGCFIWQGDALSCRHISFAVPVCDAGGFSVLHNIQVLRIKSHRPAGSINQVHFVHRLGFGVESRIDRDSIGPCYLGFFIQTAAYVPGNKFPVIPFFHKLIQFRILEQGMRHNVSVGPVSHPVERVDKLDRLGVIGAGICVMDIAFFFSGHLILVFINVCLIGIDDLSEYIRQRVNMEIHEGKIHDARFVFCQRHFAGNTHHNLELHYKVDLYLDAVCHIVVNIVFTEKFLAGNQFAYSVGIQSRHAAEIPGRLGFKSGKNAHSKDLKGAYIYFYVNKHTDPQLAFHAAGYFLFMGNHVRLRILAFLVGVRCRFLGFERECYLT